MNRLDRLLIGLMFLQFAIGMFLLWQIGTITKNQHVNMIQHEKTQETIQKLILLECKK